MKLTHLEQYDATTEQLLTLFRSRDYHQRKAIEAREARNFAFLAWEEGTDGAFSVRLQYEADVKLPKSFPARYKKHTRQSNTYIYTMIWGAAVAGEYAGRMQIEIVDMPLEVNGQMQLVAADGGCQRNIDFSIDYHKPLLGKILSPVFAGSIKRSLALEYAFNQALLAQSI